MKVLQIQLWRRASPTRRVRRMAQLNASARNLALAGLRSQRPQDSETKRLQRMADLLLGEELALQV
ncbi:MAG: hypothetical protein NTZ74_14625 [Chloroflexi bacterium]|nr:hypothetical protein [Chloroflexota bacterium]